MAYSVLKHHPENESDSCQASELLLDSFIVLPDISVASGQPHFSYRYS